MKKAEDKAPEKESSETSWLDLLTKPSVLTLFGTAIAAIFTFIGAILGGLIENGLQGYNASTLERQKYEYELISGVINEKLRLENEIAQLEGIEDPEERIALETAYKEEAARQLLFLVDIGVIRSLNSTRLRRAIDQGNLPQALPIRNSNSVSEESTITEDPSLKDISAVVNTTDRSDAIVFTGPGVNYDLAGFIPDTTIIRLSGRRAGEWVELSDGQWILGSFIRLIPRSIEDENSEAQP